MQRRTLLPLAAAGACVLLLAAPVAGQTLIAHYNFDGNLESEPINVLSPPIGAAPTGTFREGADAATATAGSAAFVLGVDGAPGSAILLDGVDDWIDLTTDGRPGLTTPQSFNFGPGIVSGTVMAWVRTTMGVEPSWLLGTDNAVDERAFRFGFNGSELEFLAHGDQTDESIGLADPTANMAWADGGWHHVAVAWDGFGDTATIYVDGGDVASFNDTSSLTSDSNLTGWEFPLALGARDVGGALEGFFHGAIDDLRVYADPLSQGAVNQIYSAVTLPDADFDGDYLVNGNDFLAWQRGYGVGTTAAEGDANDDAAVDGTDLLVWQDQFGQDRTPAAAVAAVPEPGAASLVSIAILGLLAAHWRRDRVLG